MKRGRRTVVAACQACRGTGEIFHGYESFDTGDATYSSLNPDIECCAACDGTGLLSGDTILEVSS